MMAETIFKGAMPAFYDRYLGPVSFAPYAADVAARVAALEPRRLLEIACGTGVLTYAMAAALPGDVDIVATDLSQDMIDFAASKQSGTRIVWRQADAQQIPFPDQAFDLVVCQFGVMFVPDKPAAFRQARRVLRPGGRFVFTAWDGMANNELPRVSVAAVAAMFPDDPPSFMQRVPYGYHDRAAIAEELRAAGFASVAVDSVEKTLSVPSARHYAIGVCHGGPLRGEIERRDPDGLDRATDAVARAVELRFGTGAFTASARALLVTAG